MAIETTNPVSDDNATKTDDYDVVFDNTIALKEARRGLPLGGDSHAAVTDTSYVDVPGAVHVQVDGTKLGGDMVIEVHVQCKVAAGTGTFRLYNITDTAAVASSEKTFTDTTSVRRWTSAITLASGAKTYKLQVKGSSAAALPRIWGAVIISR